MNNMRTILILATFITLIICGRMLWLSIHTHSEHPDAINGVLDLRDYTLPELQMIPLDGEWEFYSEKLITPDDELEELTKVYHTVPSRWVQNNGDSSYQFGTYRLRILLNSNDPVSNYGIRIPDVQSASTLYVNGQRLGSSGHPADQKEHYHASIVPYSSAFYNETSEVELLLHIAQDDYSVSGGIISSIKFGSSAALRNRLSLLFGSQLLLAGTFLLHAIYAGIVFFLSKRNITFLYFMCLSLTSVFMVFLTDDKLFFTFIPISFDWAIKLTYFTYALISFLLVMFFKKLFPIYMTHFCYKLLSFSCFLYVLFVLLVPATVVHQYELILTVLLLLTSLAITTQLIKMFIKGTSDIIYLILAGAALTNNVIWSSLKSWTSLSFPFYPFDLFLTVILFAAYWIKQYFKNTEHTVQLTAQLQRVNKQKDEFLAHTAHELRNPLHGIINIAQFVLDEEKNSLKKKSAENLDLLITVSQRMAVLLNDLLDVESLRGRHLKLKKKNVSLPTILFGIIDMLQFLGASKSIRFNVNIDERFPLVIADEQRLIQILFNLLHNAVKYTEEGTITITASMKSQKAMIQIIDTGIGMDQATLDRIFLPYEQGDSSVTSIGGGLGLGLSITKELIELHGGSITASSKVGVGSIFTFSLPISLKKTVVKPTHDHSYEQNLTREREDRTKLSHLPQPLTTLKILIVDDDPVNLKILENILSDEFTLELTMSANEALLKLREQDWDLVISDVMMPKISGYALTKAIRRDFAVTELPILLLTARNRSEDIHSGFLAGANDYVTKPVDAIELKARVRALTSLKQTVKEQLRLEAAWLQAQIKPHFFFNTLNTILMLIETDPEKTKALLEAFCHYLQMSFDFNNSEQVVPIQDELDLVESYLFIMNERFKDRFHVVWNVDPTCLHNQIPPLSIQPLVENALNHGLLNCSKQGQLQINLASGQHSTKVEVIDSGIGIDPTMMKKLFHRPVQKRNGVGLYNIDRRLKQLYGTGLHVESERGLGTTFSFKVPNDE